MELPKDDLLKAALACGEWMLRNQVTDRVDANRGRGIFCYDLESRSEWLTTSWTTGIQCMCLLALFKRTGREEYLKAAELAGRYIMSLQVMDQRDSQHYGTLREVTPQCVEYCPRDATTGAWALVWLHQATQDPIYLDRAILFGNWHMNFGMFRGWPRYIRFMDPDIEDWHMAGSFQSGTGLFYHDLFVATGRTEFVERGFLPIARNYCDRFFDEDGMLIGKLDALTGRIISKGPSFHHYNDDFGAAMLQTAAEFFQDEEYRKTAYRYTQWLAGQQQADGSFPRKNTQSGVPVSLMYFDELGSFYQDQELLAARDRALQKLLAMQMKTGEPKVDGAFEGVAEMPQNAPQAGATASPSARRAVNMRTTGYALMALLKLESDLQDIWLGRHNGHYIDPGVRGAKYELTW